MPTSLPNTTVFQTQLDWEFSAYSHYWEGLRCPPLPEWMLVICACPVRPLTSFLPFDSSYQMITSAGMFELSWCGGGGRGGAQLPAQSLP